MKKTSVLLTVTTWILFAFLLGGCASLNAAKPLPASGQNSTYFKPMLQPIVFYKRSCTVTSGMLLPDRQKETLLPALVAIVAPKLIDKGLDLAAAALRKAASTQPTTWQAQAGAYFYRYVKPPGQAGSLEFDGGCVGLMILAEGRQWKSFAEQLKAAGVAEGSIDGLKKTLHLEKLDNVAPRFYFEALFVPSESLDSFQLRPALLYYPEAIGSGKSGESRDLAFSFIFKDLSGKAYAAGSAVLSDLRIGTTVSPASLIWLQAPWLSAPALSQRSKEIIADVQSSQLQIREVRALEPFNLEVAVTETREARKWLEAVADVLSSSKTDLSTAISQELIPAKREAAEQAEESSQLDLEKAYELAVLEVKLACQALNDEKAGQNRPAEILKLSKTVVEKQYDADKGAIKTGRARPYSQPSTISCSQ